jgi:catechol 2,3-dioxygenase-like lactoylglutathione lyase family enzyme
MTVPTLAGIHHLKLPVRDLQRSADWYREVLGYRVTVEFVEQGRLAGLAMEHPDGGPPLAGTNPLAIAVPSDDGVPLVADVSMGKVTYGDVLVGRAAEEDLVPFGGEQAHKAFALAVGLEMLVQALAGEGYGAVLVVARPQADPVPALRALAGSVRLPGDR